ncbi:MAG: Tetratricopeptide 2 repeat protein [Verrucomicrobiales bacterium]|nr:Tetratricopeptide 2 repeat protein [Verrucomicrobiales bacterium]
MIADVHNGKLTPPLVCILAFAFLFSACKRQSGDDEFMRLTNVGKNYYEKGEGEKAIAPLQQAVTLNPGSVNAHLNLANASLLANQAENALKQAQEALALDHSSAAGFYLAGCAYLRLGNAKEAVKMLQQAKELDRTVNAVSFQLGRAYQQLGNFDPAAEQFTEVIQFEPEHAAAHWNWSQVLDRLNKPNEAAEERALHQKLLAAKPNKISDVSTFERCTYTLIRAPFRLEQPDSKGIQVVFSDATSSALGANGKVYHGPAAVIDFAHDGRNSLFVMESNGWRLLINSNGIFQPSQKLTPAPEDRNYRECLVGDLNNDRTEEILALSEQGAQVFKISTNGLVTDSTMATRLGGAKASGGMLADLNYTRKLDLIGLSPTNQTPECFRNLGFYFVGSATNLGQAGTFTGVTGMIVDDWNNDDIVDLFIGQAGKSPSVLIRERGGPFTTNSSPKDWPVGGVFTVGDLNNDLRSDLVVASGDKLVCVLNSIPERTNIPLGNWQPTKLYLLDYDNDGWLDIAAVGDGARVWRNRGNAGFQEITRTLGLDKLGQGKIVGLAAADFDQDGDSDWLITYADGHLQLLRNDGGNANQQVKLQLMGTKSNASALGTKVEVNAGGLRLARRVSSLPVEIGVGKNTQLDSLTVHWFDFPMNTVDVKVEPKTVLAMMELEQQGGSCPYFYAWDGQRFRFVSDFLSASPAGLPVAAGVYIPADAEEYVWIGNENNFKPRDGNYVLQVTEELREVLYLDQVNLAIVDHPSGTEVHSTSKLRPGKPFEPHEVVTLGRRKPLLKATREDGADATELLREIDGRFASPQRLRIAQWRGLAEPHSYTLDFGTLDRTKPLVLALTGWLRFGGGTANISAAENPELPFPFPTLEVEVAAGEWRKLDVTVGAPAGKIKSIVVDLTGKLPPGSQRLRLGQAFELHWDRIALFEKMDSAETRVVSVQPATTDLHWRGFSEYSEMPGLSLFLPEYGKLSQNPPWPITPSGWCTKYGPVETLLREKDNAVALINGGDELTLSFDARSLPGKTAGMERDFFFYSAGWEKDSDFHVAKGTVIEPIPWQGMDDQSYGQAQRPSFSSDALMEKYNVRWVGPYTLNRAKKSHGHE